MRVNVRVVLLDHAVSQNPSAAITKTFVYIPARDDGVASVDEIIAFTIIASNDGNVDLSGYNMIDERFLNPTGKADVGAPPDSYRLARIHSLHAMNISQLFPQ